MGLFGNSKNKTLTRVEVARQDVEGAFAAFIAARDALEAANEVFKTSVEENQAYMEALQFENAEFAKEIERNTRVSGKLAELIS
jgi:hypothetical protein